MPKRIFRPLRGVRVLTFETAFSLPAGTRTLAELGAEVVQVGRPGRGDMGFITWVDGAVLDKRLVAINLKDERGLDLARDLALAADIVCNNFRPLVMRRYGLDYESLRAKKPGIIVLQLSGYGGPGPWQDTGAFGPSVEAAGGLWTQMGEEDDPPMPVGSGVWADQIGGRYAAFALVAALARRDQTGTGQMLDLSMMEGISHLLGDRLLRTAVTGAAPPRTGNRAESAAPQGVYRCAGDDAWVALSVQSAAHWHVLRDLLDAPDLLDPALDSLAERQHRHDAIDAAITAWTRRHDKQQAAALLQARGIPAGPVQSVADLTQDPQYQARGAFQWLQHPGPILGYRAHPHTTRPWDVAGTARPAPTAAAGPGADNRRVLKRWLGLSAREVTQLEREGALLPAQRLNVVVPPLIGARGAARDPHFAERLGLPAPEGAAR